MYVIEGWGTGICRMIESCKNYGIPEPVFAEIGTDFRVEFFRNTDANVNATVNATVKMDVALLGSEKSKQKLK